MEYTVFFAVALAIFGALFGSFAGAQVWRLRALQLKQDKKAGEKIDRKEYSRLKKLMGVKVSKDRSRCLECGYELKWYDLIPIVSWLTLRGKCRECRRPIGRMEILLEVGLAAFFVGSFLLWPTSFDTALHIASFVTWLAAGVVLAILFAYDAKWYLLPDSMNFTLAGLGLVYAVLVVLQAPDTMEAVYMALGSVGILSGIYLVLYLISKGSWIGFGDIKLGLGLGLLLADWRAAFIALFLANFIGCLIVIPGLATKKLQRTSRVPFGPLLIVGMILSFFISPWIIEHYLFALV